MTRIQLDIRERVIMDKIELEIGDVVQIKPEHDDRFGGCFMMVTEPKNWGAQGFVFVLGSSQAKRAYYRCKFENMEFIGKAAWVPTDIYEVPE